MAKKLKIAPAVYALGGGIASELLMKYVNFGGNFSPAIPLAIGFIGMQGKGDAMQYGGAGMIGNSGSALAGNFVPFLRAKSISDDVIDAAYEEIMEGRGKQIDGGVKEQVLLGTDETGNPIYVDADEAAMYGTGGGGAVLMGVENNETKVF